MGKNTYKKQRGIAAVGTVLAAVGILSISAAAGTYMAVKQKDRLSENKLISELKNQAVAYRNVVIKEAALADDTKILSLFPTPALYWPNVSRGYAYASTQIPSSSTPEIDSDETEFYYVAPEKGPSDNIYAHYAESPRLRIKFKGNTLNQLAPKARYSSLANLDLSESMAEGLSKWVYVSDTNGTYIYLDAQPTLSGGGTNPHYQKRTLEKLQQSFGDDESKFCDTDQAQRTVIWIRKHYSGVNPTIACPYDP